MSELISCILIVVTLTIIAYKDTIRQQESNLDAHMEYPLFEYNSQIGVEKNQGLTGVSFVASSQKDLRRKSA